MRIYIKYGYRGAPTNEVYLPVGEHDVADDLAEYLIANGHALAVDAPVSPPDEERARLLTERAYIERESAALEAAPNYDALSLSELRELADAANVVYPASVKKPALIALLRAADEQAG